MFSDPVLGRALRTLSMASNAQMPIGHVKGANCGMHVRPNATEDSLMPVQAHAHARTQYGANCTNDTIFSLGCGFVGAGELFVCCFFLFGASWAGSTQSTHGHGGCTQSNSNCKTIFHFDNLSIASCAMIIILIGLLFYFARNVCRLLSATHSHKSSASSRLALCRIRQRECHHFGCRLEYIIKIRCHLNHRRVIFRRPRRPGGGGAVTA